MKRNSLETVVGALVIAAAAYFLFFALHNLEHRKDNGYELLAQFNDVGGLAPGSSVRISGVKVGALSKITLDPKTFLATVHMQIESNVHLPVDTIASINTPGLLGDKYLSLEPGNADDMLQPGGMITDTNSAASLEKLLGEVVFNLANLGKNNGGGSGSGGETAKPAGAAPAPAPAPAPKP